MLNCSVDHWILDEASPDLPFRFGNYFHGKGINDKRETEPLGKLKQFCEHCLSFNYDFRSRNFYLDDVPYHEGTFAKGVRSRVRKGKILIDGTTLNVVELASLTRALLSCQKKSFYIVYQEPLYYTRKRGDGLFRDFELSEHVNPFLAAQFFSYEIGKNSHLALFFLGFEGQRLDRAFDALSLDPRCTRLIFGSPPFNFGWEIDAFANNISIMSARDISNEVFYSGANSVVDTLNLLRELRTRNPVDRRMFLIPTGTKPHAIAAAIFANQCSDVGLLYDFPDKKSGRTGSLGKRHLYFVRFS